MKTDKEILDKLDEAEQKLNRAVDVGVIYVEAIRVSLLRWIISD